MKAKVAAGAIIAIMGIGLIAFTVSQSQAQTPVKSDDLAKFAALMQYIRFQPTPSDVKANNIPLLSTLDTNLSDIYITGFITPYTSETPEQVKARLQSVPEEDRFTAVMVESYRLASNPLLLDIIHQLLPLYYVEFFTTAQDLNASAEFLKSAKIMELADRFDSSKYAIPAPSTTGTPQPTPTMPSLALRYDPAGQDRNCDDFSTWREAQAFFLATQNDSHGLDPDSNGIACENLPGAPEIIEPTPISSFPNIINAGTYEVGKHIATGLYRGTVTQRGFSTSCTWKRWRKNGELEYEAELDIHFGVGYQFYVRVLETDYRLETNCQLTRVTDFTRPPTSELPNAIEPGMYLVGVEIKPGIYEGVVPTEDFSSCSWARHADFTGVYSEAIDTGFHSDDGVPFNVLVAPGDYGLATKCRLTFVR